LFRYDLPIKKKKRNLEKSEEILENPRKKRKLTHRNEISEKAIAKWKEDESKEKKKKKGMIYFVQFFHSEPV
jgi:hypothetical protein